MTMTANSPRLDYMHISPDLFKKYAAFGMAGKLDATLALLVDIRASQLNGCAFCLDMHVKQAKLHGERELRLHHLAIWPESHLFTPKERMALAWTEALTKIEREGVSDELYAAASEHFNETELSELTFRVVAINGWNRLNVAFRNPPGSKDQMFGLEKAGLN
ncbi:carboxymuconolactone decarboxylase family protein [Diaphorobacter ruginosibacter]|uniref:Carboxymuconolactone decarboxylase family protein n=1 Tax=Diaphorobacter ruginosibacter TaxID=1715720 RepID=A0A7G9RVN5_9BURK|nr:carboxymuconolactone decarboxylase family protein [Diaphorobacter ruginosibacter]MDR2334565.1 carboxymuconolactone decarboxylase family protein [Burkholderiaceae bacterium]QNN59660.1 carboxymuconolactone decarboxylase family protein [Diaphorobacter ruginosibacter]